MRAWQIEQQTGPSALKRIDAEKPVASGTEILVRMTAPGVVPFDVAVIYDENEASFPPSTLPLIPGNQGAGVVEDAGTCNRLKAGDRVMFGASPMASCGLEAGPNIARSNRITPGKSPIPSVTVPRPKPLSPIPPPIAP